MFLDKILVLISVLAVILAFIVRIVVSKNSFLPLGWPLGSHYYRTDMKLFGLFIIIGAVLAFYVAFRIWLVITIHGIKTTD